MPTAVSLSFVEAVSAVRALFRSKLISLFPPWRLARMAIAPARLGVSLGTMAAISAARWPTQLAVIDDRCRLTYQELDDRVAKLASVLQHDYKVEKGTPVAIMCRNHAGYVQSLLALSLLGADIVLLNTEFRGPQLKAVLGRQSLECVIADAEFDEVLNDAHYDGDRIYSQTGEVSIATEKYPSLECLAETTVRAKVRATSGSRIIVLTSGTTGVPKGAPRTQRASAMLLLFLTFLTRLPVKTGMRVLIAPPLFHGFGLLFTWLSLVLGATIVMRRKFDNSQLLADIDNYRPDLVVAVPTMFQRMLTMARQDHQRFDLTSVKCFISAGAPLSATTCREMTDVFQDKLFNLYGSSEVGIGAIATPADLENAPGCVGKPALGVQIRIIRPDGQAVGNGEVGRVVVRSSSKFEGYLGRGSRDTLDGYLDTGDLGHLDSSGRLYVDGRADDMILSGGENVYPKEVEEALLSHSEIEEAAVIGEPDAEFGQRLAAFVVLRNGNAIAEQQLTDYLKLRLERCKVPKRFSFLEELPRNMMGKVLTQQLRDGSKKATSTPATPPENRRTAAENQ